MATNRSWVTKWLTTLLNYDGALPIVVLVVPAVMSNVIGQRGILEFVSVALPIAAFIWRMFLGMRHIAANNCHGFLKELQYVTLFLGLLFLCLIDTMVILSLTLPGALTWTDYLVTGVLYAIYMSFMAVSLYPGTKASTN